MATAGGAPHVTLVLGAGGQVGLAFHAGVLSALAEVTGWDPRQASLIVGTSAGSMSGAMLRAGFPASDHAARVTGRPLSAEGAALASRIDLSRPRAAPPSRTRPRPGRMASFERVARAWRKPWTVRPGSLAAALLPVGQVPLEPLLGPMRALFGDEWPAAPFWSVAVDLDRGDRVAFGRQSAPPATVAQAVAASCAVPAFFEPVTIGERRYVDGGVHSTTNADLAADSPTPPNLVIVSAPMGMARSAAGAGFEVPIRRAVSLRLASEVGRLRRRGFDVVAFQPGTSELEVMTGNSLDSSKMPAVCERAQDAVRRRFVRADQRSRLAVVDSR